MAKFLKLIETYQLEDFLRMQQQIVELMDRKKNINQFKYNLAKGVSSYGKGDRRAKRISGSLSLCHKDH